MVYYAPFIPLTAFTAALLINQWLAGSKLAVLVLDHPNQRSLHQSPTPRTGGIGLHAGILMACAIIRPEMPYSIWPALGIVLAVSFLNDVREMPVLLRLSAHLLAAGVFVAESLASYGLPVMVLATLAIAWTANLYNFMDGSDGLAGGMALIGFSFYAIAAAAAGSMQFALVNFSIAAAAAAFLLFNFYPARIFMGDVGAVGLGFLAATLGTVGWIDQIWSWWFPVVVFSAFIVDASVTLFRRLIAGSKVWRAHSDHYYQRLVQMGWGHRKTALAEYALMVSSGCLGLAAIFSPQPWQFVIAGVAALAYATLIGVVQYAWRKFKAGTRNEV